MELRESSLTVKMVKTNIIIFAVGQLVSLIGSSIYTFAISMYILDVTGSSMSFGISFALGILPKIIFAPLSGAIVDRIDKKKIIVGSDLLSGIVLLFLLFNVSSRASVTYIYIVTMVLSIFNTFFSSAMVSSIPYIVEEDDFTKMNSISENIYSLSTIIGTLLGGTLYLLFNIEVLIFINAISFIISAISEIYLSYKNVNSNKEITNILISVKDGMIYVFSQKWLLLIMIFVLLFNSFMVIVINIGLPFVLKNTLNCSSGVLAKVNVLFPLGAVVFSYLCATSRIKVKEFTAIYRLAFIMGILMSCIGIISNYNIINIELELSLCVIGMVNFVLGGIETIINVTVMVKIQTEVEADYLGRVQGILNMFVLGFVPLSSILAGVLFDFIFPPSVMMYCGIILCVVMLGTTIIIRNIRSIQRYED